MAGRGLDACDGATGAVRNGTPEEKDVSQGGKKPLTS